MLLIALGGALGSAARYAVGGWTQRAFGAAFPYGTILVNLLGSFLLVLVMYTSVARGLLSPDLRLFLATGVMGGFTTYSTFNYETLALIQHGSVVLALANVAITVIGGLVAGGAGLLVARWLFGA